jgi:hypothetical protein
MGDSEHQQKPGLPCSSSSTTALLPAAHLAYTSTIKAIEGLYIILEHSLRLLTRRTVVRAVSACKRGSSFALQHLANHKRNVSSDLMHVLKHAKWYLGVHMLGYVHKLFKVLAQQASGAGAVELSVGLLASVDDRYAASCCLDGRHRHLMTPQTPDNIKTTKPYTILQQPG